MIIHKKKKKLKNHSYLEQQFEQLWNCYHPTIDLHGEYLGVKGRKFRFDFAHPDTQIAIEINGGTWVSSNKRAKGKSSHATGVGLERDYEKLNCAIAQGWSVFQLSSTMITVEWLNTIAKTIQSRSVSLTS